MRALLLTLCTLLLLPAPMAAAQDADDPPAGRVEVWDTPRTMDKVLLVENGTTLIIRGVTVTMHAGLVVAPTGKLVLESGPDGAPVVLKAGLDAGWIAVLGGETLVRSAPGSPAIIDGLTGEGLASGDTVLISGALKLIGRMDADGIVFRNYTSGFALQPDSRLTLRNATFESNRGMGLVGAYGHGEVFDSTFRGPGASAWTVASGTLRLVRTHFENNTFPIAQHGTRITLEDVSATNVSSCLRATKGEVVVRGLHCTEFSGSGVELARPTSGFGRVHADISGLRISSERENKAGVAVNGPDNVTIRDSELGPLHKDGFLFTGELPKVSNVTFRGVDNYNVVLLNPRGDVDEEAWTLGGESGGAGKLLVAAGFFVRASNPDGGPAVGALVEVRDETDGRLILRRLVGENGASEPTTLEVVSINATGGRTNHTYHVVAANVTQGLRWERTGYVPDGAGLAFQFTPGSGPVVVTEKAPTPGPALPLVALAGALAALALRRRLR